MFLSWNVFLSTINPTKAKNLFNTSLSHSDIIFIVPFFLNSVSIFFIALNLSDPPNISSIISNTVLELSGRIQYINEANGELVLDFSYANSTLYFSNTTNPTIAVYRTLQRSNVSTLNTNTLVSYANVVLVDNPKYHTVVPKFGSLQPSRTNLTYNFKGTSNNNIFERAYKLANCLLEETFQNSILVMTPTSTEWISKKSINK